MTKVYFCHIQAKDKVRWQQVVLPTSKVMIADNQGTIWDTVDKSIDGNMESGSLDKIRLFILLPFNL